MTILSAVRMIPHHGNRPKILSMATNTIINQRTRTAASHVSQCRYSTTTSSSTTPKRGNPTGPTTNNNTTNPNTTNAHTAANALSPSSASASSSILHQKAARAAELHAELNALLESQAQKRAQEANRPLGAGFFQFVQRSKSELINIFSAFTCVLLAWQIVNMKRYGQTLVQNEKEMQERLEEYRRVLRVLSSEEFVDQVGDSYVRRKWAWQWKSNGVNVGGGADGGWWWKGWNMWRGSTGMNEEYNDIEYHPRRDSGSATDSNDGGTGGVSRRDQEKEILISVLRAELYKVIGDRGLSLEEIQEKKLMELQREMGLVQDLSKKKLEMASSTSSSASSFTSRSKSMQGKQGESGGLEQLWEEAMDQQESSSGRDDDFLEGGGGHGTSAATRVVKRTQGFI